MKICLSHLRLHYHEWWEKGQELTLEEALPIQFHLVVTVPILETREVDLSNKARLRHYMKLELKHFIRPDFIVTSCNIQLVKELLVQLD